VIARCAWYLFTKNEQHIVPPKFTTIQQGR
jgi:hypothetical protein